MRPAYFPISRFKVKVIAFFSERYRTRIIPKKSSKICRRIAENDRRGCSKKDIRLYYRRISRSSANMPGKITIIIVVIRRVKDCRNRIEPYRDRKRLIKIDAIAV